MKWGGGGGQVLLMPLPKCVQKGTPLPFLSSLGYDISKTIDKVHKTPVCSLKALKPRTQACELCDPLPLSAHIKCLRYI